MKAKTLALCAGGIALAQLTYTANAWATWSIVAVDPVTREVGVAGASCTEHSEVIASLVPGKGSLVAQGATNLAARDKAHDALAAGGTPSAVIALITRPEDDPDTLTGGLHYQQYAVVALNMDMPATFTGTSTFSWTGVMTAPHVSVQGNTLRGPEVVKNALEAFNNPPDTDTPQLAGRLMAALEAGARAGGDRRCAAELGALSVFIKVARPEDTEDRLTLDLVERSDKFYKPGLLRLFWQLWVRPETAEGRVNPLPNLRIAYERWHKAQ
ncbi:MAG: DUF1028 domain-containing protein [Parvibaculum sp.]|nr:DUF1028 domain-containing protein [Parvibaculum sp.]